MCWPPQSQETLETLLKDKHKLEDIGEILEIAKRENKSNEKWSMRKKVIFGSIALVVLIIINIQKLEKVYLFLKGLTVTTGG